jgi:predicted RNase H-like HicB family nuclease/DNA-binding XRE family transcriptional regulator
MHYHFKVYKEDDGYWAECLELEGANSQGDTMEELRENLEEALNLYLYEPEDSKIEFPLPDKTLKGEDIIKIPVDPGLAFSIYLKDFRKRKNLTQMSMVKKLDLNSIYTYQRFESIGKANPTLKTISKFTKVFSDFDLNMIFA